MTPHLENAAVGRRRHAATPHAANVHVLAHLILLMVFALKAQTIRCNCYFYGVQLSIASKCEVMRHCRWCLTPTKQILMYEPKVFLFFSDKSWTTHNAFESRFCGVPQIWRHKMRKSQRSLLYFFVYCEIEQDAFVPK